MLKVTQKILDSPGLLEGQFNLIWPNCLQFTHCNLSQLSPRCPSSWQISQNSSGFDFDWFLFWTGENAGFDWLSPSLSSFLSGDEKNWFYFNSREGSLCSPPARLGQKYLVLHTAGAGHSYNILLFSEIRCTTVIESIERCRC